MVCTQFHWSEEDVMNMSYEKFIMYLNTVPLPDFDDDDEEDESTPDKPKKKKSSDSSGNKTNVVNLFDFVNSKK